MAYRELVSNGIALWITEKTTIVLIHGWGF